MNTDNDERRVLIGIISAWVLSALFIGIGVWICTNHSWFDHRSALEILGLSFVFPALSLSAGIGWAAKSRDISHAVGGSRPDPGTSLDLTLRYILNTTEQGVLFALTATCLFAASLEIARVLLPLLGMWFGFARFAFRVGYRMRPVLRAFGFAATFHPTMATLLEQIQFTRSHSPQH